MKTADMARAPKLILRTGYAAYAIAAALLLRQEILHGIDAEARALAQLSAARYGQQMPAIEQALTRLSAVSPERGVLEKARTLLYTKLVTPDPARAEKLLREVAAVPGKAGDKARFELARLWLDDKRTPAERAAGLDLLRQAADADEKRALATLADLLIAGVRIPRDLAQAQYYYRRAARSQPRAALTLAHLYAVATLPAPNSRASQDLTQHALALLEKRAAAGSQSSMLRLGDIYAGKAGALATGVPADPDRARHWYQSAIDAGSNRAMLKLALLLRDQDGTEAARAEALTLLQKATQAGGAEALLELGNGYRDGLFGPPDPAQAFSAFQRVAALGLPGGMLALGKAYMTGNGVARDPVTGLDWLHRAAAAGSPGAHFEIGLAYQQGWGLPQDDAEAYRWFLRAALAGYGSAMAAVSRALETGAGVAHNADDSLRWADRAVEAGVRSRRMLIRVAQAYAAGEVVPQNIAKAIHWLELSADQNDSDAMILLGRLLMLNRSASAEAAVAWFRRAEQLGDPDALMALGRAYASGFGVPLSERKAFEYFHRASHLGSINGVREVGHAYAIGFGVQKNPTVALDWYLRAAERGDTKAMLTLNYFYDTGFGVAPNKAAAIAWLRRSADGGNPGAQYRFGIALLTGNGLVADQEQAQRYLEQASAKKFQPAVAALDILSRPTHPSADKTP